MLLHGRARADPARVLNPGRDVDRLDARQVVHPVPEAPGRKLTDGAVVGAASIRIGDLGGEKLPEAALRPAILYKEAGWRSGAEAFGFPALDFRDQSPCRARLDRNGRRDLRHRSSIPDIPDNVSYHP